MVSVLVTCSANGGDIMIRMGRGALAVLIAWGLTLTSAPALGAQQADGYARSSSGTRTLTLGSGTVIKMLLDASNLDSDEIEVAEITFAVGPSATTGHRHGAMEIFYIIEGVLGHVVNGVEHRLEPGMAGVVKPSDEIIHRVLSDEPVRAVVLWVPGGEGDRIAPADRWTRLGARPLDSAVRVASGDEARGDEERAVIAAAQALFDAMGALDPDAFRASMVPDGFLMAVGSETTRRTTRDDFAARIADQSRPMIERMWGPEVRIDGPVATLWAPYDFYSSVEFSHCGTDAFQLAKTPEGWKVVMVSYTMQMPPTCSRHPEGPPGIAH